MMFLVFVFGVIVGAVGLLAFLGFVGIVAEQMVEARKKANQ
jgi:hypothetical protein